MAVIDSTGFLVSLLCLVAVLTSSVSAVAGPDGTSSASPSLSQDCSSKSSSATTGKHPHCNVTDDKQIPKNLTSTSMMAEGGPIPISTSPEQQENIKAPIEADTSHEFRARENMPKERFAAPSVVARKGVEEKKVKARKGVNQSSLDSEQATTSFSQTTLENARLPVAENATTAPARADDQAEASNVDAPKSNVSDSRPNADHADHHSGAKSSSILIPVNASTSHTESTNDTTIQKSSPPAETKHVPKPKPTVTTVGKSETNEARLPSRNKGSLSGKPRKIDYIVPVIITIIAVPLLGTAIFLLYRRGRDCWDKRHYRRMDFLIDGMYND
ncbi:PREDICTED: uncharacterized protein LOC106749861 [Dinoponera quadriceps]|uniref:Uncharacterized protein LOC106749861 n=1 Tax=Dinoponera quadriceps TaxID=609295 RepID=A0A6P3Y2W4_DINQU|nr:PREDICTED: uncharacterized protein LOC106749861 [Dinoponera quadriceps]